MVEGLDKCTNLVAEDDHCNGCHEGREKLFFRYAEQEVCCQAWYVLTERRENGVEL